MKLKKQITIHTLLLLFAIAYYRIIAKENFSSASLDLVTNGKWNHDNFWTETYANYLSTVNSYFTPAAPIL